MDERRKPSGPVPQRRRTEARDDAGEVLVGGRELVDRPLERRLVEGRDQATVPPSPKPVAGSGSKARPAAPRSHARAFSPSDGR